MRPGSAAADVYAQRTDAAGAGSAAGAGLGRGGARCGAEQALQRIEAVLPPELRERLDSILLYAPQFQMRTELRERLDAWHEAWAGRHPVRFDYVREDGAETKDRTVRPLALDLWSGVWTLVAWCELREDFRTFRIDRMGALQAKAELFALKVGQRLEDYLRRVVPAADLDDALLYLKRKA